MDSLLICLGVPAGYAAKPKGFFLGFTETWRFWGYGIWVSTLTRGRASVFYNQGGESSAMIVLSNIVDIPFNCDLVMNHPCPAIIPPSSDYSQLLSRCHLLILLPSRGWLVMFPIAEISRDHRFPWTIPSACYHRIVGSTPMVTILPYHPSIRYRCDCCYPSSTIVTHSSQLSTKPASWPSSP